ncbi:MAG: hypothetical protein AAB768_04015 [Patescibacteria group bacterium]
MPIETGFKLILENWPSIIAVGILGSSAILFGFVWLATTFGDSGTESHDVFHL